MSQERWQRIREVFMGAVDLPAEQRRQFLDTECGADFELRREVEEILEADEDSDDIFGEAFAEAAKAFQPPDHISHYRVLEKLGEGGMGVVYKAEDTRLRRHVALKFLAPYLVSEPEARKRLEREARAAAALDHPNICTVHEIDEVDGLTFIVLAFLDGKTLSARIAEGPLEVDEVRSIAHQLAEGLAAAHSQGVVHRDMKPGNVMLTSGPKPLAKIMDFGLARLEDSTQITRVDSTMGTVGYMSPEQALGWEVDHRTDIWSLGAIVYEMLSGRRPFRAAAEQAVIYLILNEDPEPLGKTRRDIPAELAGLVDKALSKRPEDRYQSAGAFLQDLAGARDSTRTPPRLVRRARERKATPAQFVAFTAIVSALMALGFVLLNESRPDPAALADPPDVTQFTSYPGIEMDPAFKPDGDQIAFTWNGEDQANWDVYVKQVGPGRPLRLTTDPNFDHSPVYSPDGLSIAFLRGYAGEEKDDVFVVPALGGQERRVTQISEFSMGFQTGTCLDWSPAGDWLVVCDGEGSLSPMSLFLVEVSSGERRRLTSPAEGIGDYEPAFSPDGRMLAFARFESALASDIYLLPLADDLTPLRDPLRRTFLARQSTGPVFTADGSEIVFASGGLWKMAVEGSEPPERTPFFGERGEDVTIARQKNRAAFVEARGNTDIWRLDLPADGGTSGPIRLIDSTDNDEYPQYSPDGSEIVYHSKGSGALEIWKSDADGSNAVQLTALGSPTTFRPQWSPDGTRIAFTSDAAGEMNVYVINADGGEPRRLTASPGPASLPWWSHDGEWIYYHAGFGREARIKRIRPAGGEPIEVGPPAGLCMAESSDGKFFYCVGPDPKPLLRVPVEGGEPDVVIEAIHRDSFDVVEEGVFFVAKPGVEIKFLRFATGKIESVFRLDKSTAYGFSVSPDGRSILFGQGERLSNIMLVENFR